MAFHWLFRSLLHNAARQKVYGAAEEAVRERLRQSREPAAETDDAALPEPCDVAVVFPSRAELAGLQDRMQEVRTFEGDGIEARLGVLRERHVVAAQSGGGCDGAARTTEAMIAGYRPAWVIAAGFADSLRKTVQRGHVVMVDRVADVHGHELSIDLKVDPRTLASQSDVHLGRLLTLDAAVASTDERAELGRKHEALAADLESLAVAEVCRRAKVRFLAIRVIRQGLDDQLPADVRHLKKQKSIAAKAGALLGAAVRRPSSMKDLWQLKEDALLASDRLAKFLDEVIVQLAPRTRSENDEESNQTDEVIS